MKRNYIVVGLVVFLAGLFFGVRQLAWHRKPEIPILPGMNASIEPVRKVEVTPDGSKLDLPDDALKIISKIAQSYRVPIAFWGRSSISRARRLRVRR